MNDYSAVVRVDYGKASVLLTGDASVREIVDDQPGHVDVLKAAHHGSETGTTPAVLDATSPKYVVMSYEEDNSYGHPDQSVFDTISTSGATAYSTERQEEAAAAAAQQQQQAETVYITNTGSKYHHAGCQYLRQSSIPISLSDAQARDYTPRSRCCH